MLYRKFLPAFAALALALASLNAARASGAEIVGTVTDPMGAVVAGAQVTATDTATQKSSTATTDSQGRYKISGLAAGTYVVSVTAQGFAETKQENVRVEDSKTATANVKMLLPAVEGSVNVTAPKGSRPGIGDSTYQQLRNQAASSAEFTSVASVTNLVLKRDAGTFTLRSGEIYFLAPVEDRTVGAVFVGEGEFTLTPPVDYEKRSLALFTGEPSITEQFTKLTLRFTDKTFEEVKSSPNAKISPGGAQAQHAKDIYRDNQVLLRRELRTNMELRTLIDMHTPQRPGFFIAFIGGKRFEKLIFQLDPLGIPEVSPEEVLLASYGETDGGFWTAFHLADEYARGTGNSDEDHRIFDITHHEIDGAINNGTKMTATDTVTLRALQPGARVLPFSLFSSLRASRVTDEQGREMPFVQEGKDRDADFGVIFPEPLEAGKTYKLKIEYAGGDALSDLGGGNFFLGPRLTWYPNNSGTQFGDRATFDITMRFPRGKMFIGTGAPSAPDGKEGDTAVARWTSGETELAVAGFNYGRFKKKEVLDPDTGYNIEFYANEDLPNFMQGAASVGSMSTMGMADSAIADAENSTRIYDVYFGKLPYKRLAMTQQPAANFGQAWPTLVYMPFTAFMDATQRYMATGSSQFAGDDFFRYVGPHEIAHQWWGHTVGWKSYRDQWMSEGFAEFSASLFAQLTNKGGAEKLIDFYNNQRDLIVNARPQTRDRKPYTVGAVTQGYRLNSGKTGNIARFMIYPKGAYILHMLRQLMFDPRQGGDKHFMETMQDFIKSHYNQDVSTEDFKRSVEKHMTKEMDVGGNGRMDWFFDAWVYGTEIPSYRLDYQINGNVFTGRITQSGVSDNFSMRVPVYLDFGKGWVRLGAANLIGNKTVEIPNITLPQAPKRAAIAAYNDVLALNIDNVKK